MLANQKCLYLTAYTSQILLKIINNCKKITHTCNVSCTLSSGCDCEVEWGSNRPARPKRHARKMGYRTLAHLQ